MDTDDLYQDLILEHAKHPRHKGALEGANAVCAIYNPLCGDQIEVRLLVKDGKIEDLRFEGHGCSISQASASAMSELLHGKTIDEGEELVSLFRTMMRNELSEEELVQLGDARALEGVRKFSARVKCATLAWEALHQCIRKSREPAPQNSREEVK